MDLKTLTDLDLIIFLVAKKHTVVNTKLEGNRSLVYFNKTKELEKDILTFVNGTDKINITEYQAAEKRVKTILYANKSK